jgi:hypothetical protein
MREDFYSVLKHPYISFILTNKQKLAIKTSNRILETNLQRELIQTLQLLLQIDFLLHFSFLPFLFIRFLLFLHRVGREEHGVRNITGFRQHSDIEIDGILIVLSDFLQFFLFFLSIELNKTLFVDF